MAGTAPGQVCAEIQGIDGPFTFPERLLQRIWAEGWYNEDLLHTTDGRRVRVRHPGRWNHLGGPDFKGARLELGGTPLTGDVELHLRASDWDAHGHARDPAYAGVVLHVVLFPAGKSVDIRHGGLPIPTLCLLPALPHDLEEFAADAAVEQLAGRPLPELVQGLGALPEAERDALLASHTAARWRQKCHFAAVRVDRLGWDEACHQTALEILGYHRNRAPMLAVATRWGLAAWSRPTLDLASCWQSCEGRWAIQGVRPANHPRLRLEQYATWARNAPDWPTRWAELASPTAQSGPSQGAAGYRREARLGAWRDHVATRLGIEHLGQGRWTNMLVDGLIPLAAARTHASARYETQVSPAPGDDPWFAVWSHFWPGDAPDFVAEAARALGYSGLPGRPLTNGVVQGLLGWWIARAAAGANAQ